MDGDSGSTIEITYISSNTGFKERTFARNIFNILVLQMYFTKEARYKIIFKKICCLEFLLCWAESVTSQCQRQEVVSELGPDSSCDCKLLLTVGRAGHPCSDGTNGHVCEALTLYLWLTNVWNQKPSPSLSSSLPATIFKFCTLRFCIRVVLYVVNTIIRKYTKYTII